MTKDLLDKAEKALASARLLLAADDGDGAANRAYYAMFDAAMAALLSVGSYTNQTPPKTHSGLISRFGHTLVQTGRVPAEMGRSLNRVNELRMAADYLAEPVPVDKARRAIDEASIFVASIRDFLAH